MQLALFDFDGTISSKDSLGDFIQYALGKPIYYTGLLKLSPVLIAYGLGFIPNDIAKEKLISHFFKGWNAAAFEKLASQYSVEQIDKIIRPEALKKINWHQQQGHKIVIVSASLECWLKAWCEKNGIELIATQLEVINGKLSGKFASKNCHGAEKVQRINKAYHLDRYDYIYAYGDSQGDKELLALANESFYKPFR